VDVVAINYAFFARAGFTDAAQALAMTHGALLVDLARLDRDLETTSGPWPTTPLPTRSACAPGVGATACGCWWG